MTDFDGGLWRAESQGIALGLDQSLTAFGITALTTTGDLRYYTSVYTPPGKGVQRLGFIRSWLKGYLKNLDDSFLIEAVAMEDTIRSPHANTAQMLGELAGTVKLTIYDHFVAKKHPVDLRTPYRIPPTTLKKYVTEKGNAPKSVMIKGVYKNWGVDLDDDNAADSFSLAHLISGRASTAVQKDVYTKILRGGEKHKDVIL